MVNRRLTQTAAMVIALMGADTYAHFRRIAEERAGTVG
jgi:hypothetical protein